MQRLGRQIEGLRAEMIRVAESTGNLLDPRVIEISQQLDQLLLMMQRLQQDSPRKDARLYSNDLKERQP
jgi:hypothetical protein